MTPEPATKFMHKAAVSLGNYTAVGHRKGQRSVVIIWCAEVSALVSGVQTPQQHIHTLHWHWLAEYWNLLVWL